LAAEALGAAMREPEIATRAAVMMAVSLALALCVFMGWRVGGWGYPQVDFGAIRGVLGALASRHGSGCQGRVAYLSA